MGGGMDNSHSAQFEQNTILYCGQKTSVAYKTVAKKE